MADGPRLALQCCRCSWRHKGSVVASHTYSFWIPKTLNYTEHFFFLCAWDTWHLAAGSLARQMSVIDILGMRLDFMIWLFKKEMSSVTENGINGGEKTRQSNKNQPPNASAGWTPPVSCAMTYLAMPFVTSASPGLEQNKKKKKTKAAKNKLSSNVTGQKRCCCDIFNCVLLIRVHFLINAIIDPIC